VRARLQNLGYFHGSLEDPPDAELLRDALMEFQGEHQDTHDLEPHGDADAASHGALTDVSGA
jgi:hypothetical protein